jgi:hypothetical protein
LKGSIYYLSEHHIITVYEEQIISILRLLTFHMTVMGFLTAEDQAILGFPDYTKRLLTTSEAEAAMFIENLSDMTFSHC